MNMQLVNEVTKSQLKKDVPFFKSGSTVRVHVKIKEGDKSRKDWLSQSRVEESTKYSLFVKSLTRSV